MFPRYDLRGPMHDLRGPMHLGSRGWKVEISKSRGPGGGGRGGGRDSGWVRVGPEHFLVVVWPEIRY